MSSAPPYKLVALFLIHAFTIAGFATPRTRPHPAGRPTVKIIFEPNNPVVGPGKSTTVKATAVDQKNQPVKGAKIRWTVPRMAEDLISITKPLTGSDDSIIIVGLSPASGPAAATDVTISASSGKVSNDLVLHYSSEPVDVVLTPAAIDLMPGTKATIIAKVLDAAGHELHGLNVTWNLADKKFEDLIFLGPPVNNATTNSIDIVWLRKEGQKPTQVPIIARVGLASAVANITYEPEEKGTGRELIFSEDKTGSATNEVSISPTEKKKVKANVKDKGTVITDAQLNCDLSDDDRDFVTVNTKTKGEISLVGLGGDFDKPTRTILLPCRAAGANAVLVIRYDAGSIDIEFQVLSKGIAGDNYGRTIRNDYYCIDVTLHNKSGADFTASLLRFVNPFEDASIPIAYYKTVHGSIARRKITHPRSMTLAIIEGTGTLMTGFNAFFHNEAHATNYSQFINVISNPLRNGLDKAWKDPYPDELSRFEENVLRDNTILKKDDDLKTTVFVPKRAVHFSSWEMKFRDDPIFVKGKLGRLEVIGYQFTRIGRRTFISKP